MKQGLFILAAILMQANLYASPCKEYTFVNNLTVYRDPKTWDLSDNFQSFENTRLTTFRGTYQLKLEHDKSFTAKSYLVPGKKLTMIPVTFCDGGYTGTLGYVEKEGLAQAQIDETIRKETPPSTLGNSIPTPLF